MIHELRTYTFHPGKQPEYLKFAEEIGRPIRGNDYGLNQIPPALGLGRHIPFAARVSLQSSQYYSTGNSEYKGRRLFRLVDRVAQRVHQAVGPTE